MSLNGSYPRQFVPVHCNAIPVLRFFIEVFFTQHRKTEDERHTGKAGVEDLQHTTLFFVSFLFSTWIRLRFAREIAMLLLLISARGKSVNAHDEIS